MWKKQMGRYVSYFIPLSSFLMCCSLWTVLIVISPFQFWSWSWCNSQSASIMFFNVVLVLREILWCVLLCVKHSQFTRVAGSRCFPSSPFDTFVLRCDFQWVMKSKNTNSATSEILRSGHRWFMNAMNSCFLKGDRAPDCVNQQWQQRAHSLFFSKKKMSWLTFTVEMNQSFPAGTVNSFRTHIDLCHDIGWCLSHQAMTLIWEFSKSSNKQKKKKKSSFLDVLGFLHFFLFFLFLCVSVLVDHSVVRGFPKTSNNGKCLIETTYGTWKHRTSYTCTQRTEF